MKKLFNRHRRFNTGDKVWIVTAAVAYPGTIVEALRGNEWVVDTAKEKNLVVGDYDLSPRTTKMKGCSDER